MKSGFVTLISSFLFLVSSAQVKTSYADFLHNDDEKQPSLVYGFAAYAYALPSRVSYSGTGPKMCIGINAARFFTKKFHVGVYAGGKLKSLLFETGYSEGFSAAIRENYDASASQGADTLLPEFFVGQMSKRPLGGSTMLQYGFSFFVPPRYLPMLRVYGMRVSDAVEGSSYQQMMGQKEQDWIVMSYKGKGVALDFDLSGIHEKINVGGAKLILSIYGEKYDLYDAKVESRRLDSFIRKGFFDKYGSFYRYGISLGLGYF